MAEMIRSICVWLLTTALLLYAIFTVSGIFGRYGGQRTGTGGKPPFRRGAGGGRHYRRGVGNRAGRCERMLKGTTGVFGPLGVLACAPILFCSWEFSICSTN